MDPLPKPRGHSRRAQYECEYWQGPVTETCWKKIVSRVQRIVFTGAVPEVEAKKKLLAQLFVSHPLNGK